MGPLLRAGECTYAAWAPTAPVTLTETAGARTVNSVADAIADEFPHVVVDTLAYQYTRPAPNITVPRKNVVIRLCSIECNFAAPLVRLTACLTHCRKDLPENVSCVSADGSVQRALPARHGRLGRDLQPNIHLGL